MRDHPLEKGTTMLIEMILAIICLLAVGVAFNIIGEHITK